MQLAIGHSGDGTVTEAVRRALEPFTEPDGGVTLPARYRVLVARTGNAAHPD